MHYNGTIYTSATITATGSEATWRPWPILPVGGLRVTIVATIAGDDTIDLLLRQAVDSSGTGEHNALTFTQLTSSTTEDTQILDRDTAAPIHDYWKFSWTIGGAPASVSFIAYATVTAT